MNFLKRVTGADLAVLDDFGIKPLTPQLPIANWPEVIPDPVTCEAITDRFVSRAIQVTMRGESYRKKFLKGLDTN